MNTKLPTLLAFLILATGVSSAAFAQGNLAGSWKLTMGHKAPCSLTMAADGSVTAGSDCAYGTEVTHWAPTSTGVQLQTASGETYAVLHPKGEAYEGQTFADMHNLVLSH